MKQTVSACFLFLMIGAANAITWGAAEKTDPITGDKVMVAEWQSSGSYIYFKPSKYDLVFWPFTDENWIWIAPNSGYASFGNDFAKLSDSEKKRLAQWLKVNYKLAKNIKSHKEKLAWLEKIYAQRVMDDDFWCHFYRLMAYVHRDDEQNSLEYVRKTLPLLQKSLATKPKDVKRVEVLYLLGEYNRRIGQEKMAHEYFTQVKTEKYRDKDGQEKVGHPYFLELVQDREKLMKKVYGTKR